LQRFVVLAGFALASFAPSLADTLELKNGRALTVARWWRSNDTIYYETDAGRIGIPATDVARIVPGEAATPRISSHPEPAEPSPSREQLDQRIEQLEVLLRREAIDSRRQEIQARLADSYTLRARSAKQQRQPELARDYLERALAAKPQHVVARLDLIWLLLEVGRTDRAQSVIAEGLTLTPSDARLLAASGEVRYRQNQIGEALADFRAAQSIDPTLPGLAERIVRLERESQSEADDSRRESQHFVVSFDGERDRVLAREIQDQLEVAWTDLARELDCWPQRAIPVVISSREEFGASTSSGPEVAGLFDGKIRLPVGGVTRVDQRLIQVIRHELTHAILHEKGAGRVPRWLHEGLAQLLEPRDAARDRERLRALAANGSLSISPFSYPTALSFVQHLETQYGRARLLWLVDRLAEVTAENEAFLQTYGLSQEEMLESWRRSLTERS
jgi:tetratricopeptide (TPR) repeat protein